MAEQYINFLASTTLNGAITSGATTLTIAPTAYSPTTAQFRIRIGNELLTVTTVAGGSSQTYTVSRGAESTTAAAHASGSTVTYVLTAASLLAIGGASWSTPLSVANGGTNASSASITAFNNITGYSASGATGTTSTNLVFSTSPTLLTPTVTTSIKMSGYLFPASDSTTALQFRKADASTSVMNIDTTNGRVGIGTTSPSRDLTVGAGGSSTANPGIAVDGGSASGGGPFIDFRRNGTSQAYFGTSSGVFGDNRSELSFEALTGNGIGFYTNANGTAKLSVTTGGLIGIGSGTGTPTYGLQWQPTSGVTAGSSFLFQDATASTGATRGVIQAGAGQSTTNQLEFWPNGSSTPYVSVGPATLSGSSTTSNWLNITGTFPTSLSATTNALNIQVTTAGSSAQITRGLLINMAAGYTGSSINTGLYASCSVAGTGTWDPYGVSGAFNSGLNADALAATAGSNVGGFYRARSSTGISIGMQGVADSAGSGSINYGSFGTSNGSNVGSSKNIGAIGIALNGSVNVGGFFGLLSTAPTFVSGALQASNGTTVSDIFDLFDNATNVFTVADGGNITATGVLQAGGYKSSDGSTGATAGPYTTITSITVKNGLITAITGA